MRRGPVLIAFRVENKRKAMVKAYLAFEDFSAEPNMACPHVELKQQISAGMQADMLITHKVRPEQPWGKLSYSFRCKDLSLGGEEEVKTPRARNQQVQINVMPIAGNSEQGTSSTECPHCSKSNDVTAVTCEACGEALVGEYMAI